MSEPSLPVSVSPVKIVPRGVSPMVWPRVVVRSDMTIAQLFHVIQTVMGREDEHRFRWETHGFWWLLRG